MKIVKRLQKHFNLMIDVCFWGQAIVLFKILLMRLGVLPTPFFPDNWWGDLLYLIQNIVHLGSIFALFPILLLPFLRDEYADRLWKKAATAFTSLLILSPLIWWLGWRLDEYLGRGPYWWADHPPGRIGPDVLKLGDICRNVGFHQLEGIDIVLGFMFLFLPLAFATLYKWYRWRASRG